MSFLDLRTRTRALSLGHIAYLVGFRDQGSFSRVYRRRFQVAPSLDRRSR